MTGKDVNGNITVPIDAGRLTDGLKTMFFGLSEVFASLGQQAQGEGFKRTADDIGVSGAGNTSTNSNNISAASEADPANAADKASPSAKKPEKDLTAEAAEEAKKASGDTPKAAEKATEDKPSKTSSVTMPEIIKIVTKKIEADRGNSTKIGDIVKSFGIGKLTELPEDKYEAFLTQLTAL